MAGKEIKRQVKTGKVEYCLRTAPSPTYTTKFRVPKENCDGIPDVIVDPDYDKIMELLKGVR